jgi:hypothetical protein
MATGEEVGSTSITGLARPTRCAGGATCVVAAGRVSV